MNKLDNLGNSGFRAVNLVDDHHRRNIVAQRLSEHETGLRHRAVNGVHQQKTAIGHVHDALHLAAEIGVARSVDDIDLRAVVVYGGVLGENRDAALLFQGVGVHNQLSNLLVGAEHMPLLQQGIHQSSLAVIDVRDDGNVSYSVV